MLQPTDPPSQGSPLFIIVMNLFSVLPHLQATGKLSSKKDSIIHYHHLDHQYHLHLLIPGFSRMNDIGKGTNALKIGLQQNGTGMKLYKE